MKAKGASTAGCRKSQVCSNSFLRSIPPIVTHVKFHKRARNLGTILYQWSLSLQNLLLVYVNVSPALVDGSTTVVSPPRTQVGFSKPAWELFVLDQ